MLNPPKASKRLRNAWFNFNKNSTEQNISLVSFAYGFNSNKHSRSDVILFYYGEKVEDCPYTLDRILNDFINEEWEKYHDFIQWLFPNTEPSQYNDKAPILTEADIAIFKSNTMLQNTVDKSVFEFMRFLGFAICYDDATEYGVSIYQRYDSQLSTFNHNHLRITRMLKFLKAIGHWMLHPVFYTLDRACVVPTSRQYWKEVYNG